MTLTETSLIALATIILTLQSNATSFPIFTSNLPFYNPLKTERERVRKYSRRVGESEKSWEK
jgi:hypothetical protein